MSALALLAAAPATGGHGGSKSPWALLLVGLFFIVVAGIQALNPRLLWKTNRWAYKNPEANEPSDKAFTVMRIVGVVVAIAGVVFVVVAITKF